MTISRCLSTLALLAACGDHQGAAVLDATRDASSGDAAASSDAVVDAALQCDRYPIPMQPAAGVRAAAQAELDALSPAANMMWNDNTGTLSSIIGLDVPLPGCIAGQDVGTQVFGVLAAHPALFQLDLTEWSTPDFFDCQFADGALVSMGRHSLAGRPLAKDVFAYALAKIGGVMTLTNVFGTYVPTAPAGVPDAMVACNSFTEAEAVQHALQTPLQATVFDQCNPTGPVSYTPHANDTFTLAPEEAWIWDEANGEVLLLGQRTLRVQIDPSNFTPELLSSSARCPIDPGSDFFTIGFDIVFDVHTGVIIQVTPGLDCVVC